MVQINFARREVNCKIVYYGPGLSGKTTNLEVVHKKAPPDRRGELTSIATEGDRTLFFDYMPLDLGKVGGMNTKFQLYTVPGQVYYNATRKLVLQGADGVIFVADSRESKLQENIESLQNLEDNLKEQGLEIRNTPLVIQWNKRDLPEVMAVEDLEREVNKYGVPTMEASAKTGEGVFPTLKKLAGLVLDNLNKQYGVGTRSSSARSGARKGAGAGASRASGAGAGVGAAAPAAVGQGAASGAGRGAPPQPSAPDRRGGPPSARSSASGAPPQEPPSGTSARPTPARPSAPPDRARPPMGGPAGPASPAGAAQRPPEPRAGRVGRGIPEPQPMRGRKPEAAPGGKGGEGGGNKMVLIGVVAVVIIAAAVGAAFML